MHQEKLSNFEIPADLIILFHISSSHAQEQHNKNILHHQFIPTCLPLKSDPSHNLL